MNCDCPIIAIRRAGINPQTNVGYKPHAFIKWQRYEDDAEFVRQYFISKEYEERLGNETLLIGCGRCPLCVRRNKRAWATRCIHEAQMSNGGVFLTLTVSDKSLPVTFPNGSLRYEPFQLFMKRLRKGTSKYKMERLGDVANIRFFMCGEYGEQFGRPHYHVILFGFTFPSSFVQRYTESGQPLYDSPFLQELRYVDGQEVFGEVSNFAPVTPYDVSYTCGYVEKKLYTSRDKYIKDGKAPEFVNMSRRPGIGAAWLKKYYGDCWKFYSDTLIDESCWAGNWNVPVPRFYFNHAQIKCLLSTEKFDIIRSFRRDRASAESSTPEALVESLKRSHAKAAIVRQRLSQVSRKF